MATAQDGTEFHLGFAEPSEDEDLDYVRQTLGSIVRGGDGVFVWEGRVYVAIASDVPGTGLALRRMMGLARKKGLDVKVRLLHEPFSPDLASAASKVILGEVPIVRRDDS